MAWFRPFSCHCAWAQAPTDALLNLPGERLELWGSDGSQEVAAMHGMAETILLPFFGGAQITAHLCLNLPGGRLELGGSDGSQEVASMHGMSFLGEQGSQEDVYLIRSRFGSTCSLPHPTSFSQSRPPATVMRTQPVIGRSQFPRSSPPIALSRLHEPSSVCLLSVCCGYHVMLAGVT